MNIKPSKIIESMGTYAFIEVKQEVEKLKAAGISPIDFGVGDPKAPTPNLVRKALKEAAEKRSASGYPIEEGQPEFRQAVSEWTKRRFDVDLDPDTQISATIGAKECVFNFHHGFVDPGDYVIMPNPGYPPYEKGTLFAHGVPYFMPVTKENDFLMDIASIPKEIAKKAKILWLNSPHNPTGKVAPKEYLKEVIDFGKDNNVIIASDECYSELYFDEKPMSVLQLSQEGVVQIQSLSKRSNMTCYRVGWIAGDPDIMKVFKKMKPNIDSGTPTFIEDAAIAALSDEIHVDKMREEYREKRNMIVDALVAAGLEDCQPEATLYIWQKVPDKMSSVNFAKTLLKPETAIVTTPGSWLASNADNQNPGEGYVRFALVPERNDVVEAAERIRKLEF